MESAVKLIHDRLKLEAEAESERYSTKGIYRGSQLGGCLRAIQYSALKTPAIPPSPQAKLIFRDGHLHHTDLRELLGKVGLVTHVETPISRKYSIGKTKFTITGTIDGRFNGTLFDIKSIKHYRFLQLDKKFPQDYMQYLIQINFYMDILNEDEAFFLFKDKDTGELKEIWVKRDHKLIDSHLTKLANMHESLKKGKLLARPYSYKDWHCNYCAFKDTCWRGRDA